MISVKQYIISPQYNSFININVPKGYDVPDYDFFVYAYST